MEKQTRKFTDTIVLADMHCDGVYFDPNILSARLQEKKENYTNKTVFKST